MCCSDSLWHPSHGWFAAGLFEPGYGPAAERRLWPRTIEPYVLLSPPTFGATRPVPFANVYEGVDPWHDRQLEGYDALLQFAFASATPVPWHGSQTCVSESVVAAVLSNRVRKSTRPFTCVASAFPVWQSVQARDGFGPTTLSDTWRAWKPCVGQFCVPTYVA